jgi:hypothetical protein
MAAQAARKPKRRMWTKKAIREAFTEFRDSAGWEPRQIDCATTTTLPAYSTVHRHFGSIHGPLWPKQAILDALHDFTAENGHEPKRSDFPHPDLPPFHAVEAEFGRLKTALESM